MWLKATLGQRLCFKMTSAADRFPLWVKKENSTNMKYFRPHKPKRVSSGSAKKKDVKANALPKHVVLYNNRSRYSSINYCHELETLLLLC